MDRKLLDRAYRIIEAAKNSAKVELVEWQLDEIQLTTNGYAEPGYSDPESGIIATGNWNPIWKKGGGHKDYDDETMPRVAKLFEKLGIELEWSDEWINCCQCGRLVRTAANCYGWTRSYHEFDGEIVCHECVFPEEVLKDLEGNDRSALTLDIDPERHGYVKVGNRYEHGLYGGQNDDPQKIGESLRKQGIERFLFKIDGVGQFDVSFSVYVHESEAHKLNGRPEGKADIDPAVALDRALRQGSIESGKLEGEGIKYIKCNADGTATARIVSPEEFLAGIKE